MTAFALTLEWPDGREETVSATGTQTVVEAAEDAGIALPIGCRTGACATCVGQLLEGRIDHRRRPRALKPRHHEEDYVLLCIAEPRTDCRLRVGSAIQRELVTNPWN